MTKPFLSLFFVMILVCSYNSSLSEQLLIGSVIIPIYDILDKDLPGFLSRLNLVFSLQP